MWLYRPAYCPRGMEKSGLVNSEGELTGMSEQWIRLSVEDQFVM